jgi:sugar phosphate isomerase/epimerase
VKKKLKLLIATNYKGYLSLEYERRWHPNDLPESSKGMAFGSKHIRECIDQLVEL